MKAVEIFNQYKNGTEIAGMHLEDSSAAYLIQVQKELTTLINTHGNSDVSLDKDTLILINGDYKSGLGGMVKIVGPRAEQVREDLKKLVTNLKDSGRGNTFQGKSKNTRKARWRTYSSILSCFKLSNLYLDLKTKPRSIIKREIFNRNFIHFSELP